MENEWPLEKGKYKNWIKDSKYYFGTLYISCGPMRFISNNYLFVYGCSNFYWLQLPRGRRPHTTIKYSVGDDDDYSPEDSSDYTITNPVYRDPQELVGKLVICISKLGLAISIVGRIGYSIVWLVLFMVYIEIQYNS